MKWLLWKDYRHNRLVVLVGLFLLVLPYVVAFGAACWQMLVCGKVISATDWSDGLYYSSVYSLFVSQLTVALIGGNVIAGERADRATEFFVLAAIHPSKTP